MSKYVIFSDGASKGNPGPGGWGAVVVMDDTVMELGGREERTTNNRMELMAAIEGLSSVQFHPRDVVTVYADSRYVIDGITKWVHGWQKNGWKTSLKQAVVNDQLWKQLVSLVYESGVRVNWQYVGGHVGVAGNERADEIASGFAEGMPVELYRGPLKAYGVDVNNLAQNGDLASSKLRSGGKAYSYVSEVEGQVRVHKTWAECEARVHGQKARFRKALSAGDEREIITKFSKGAGQ